MKHCIFHYPEPVVDKPGIGSALRPRKMLDAFRAIGYEVDEISGYSAQRKEKIAGIKAKISAGVKYDFVYSESVNSPTLMTDPDHIPRHPGLDFGFFHYCKKQGIPIGLFYRDIHWMFPLYKEAVSKWKRAVLLPMFRYDLKMYRRLVDILYVPSQEMGQMLPGLPCVPLPPGGVLFPDALERRAKREYSSPLKVFYVGNVTGGVYDLRKFCKAVQQTPGVELTICCPAESWQRACEKYEGSLCDRIHVIHKKSHELQHCFEEADVFTCCLETNEYVRIAMPIKVFEATGYGVPVLITNGVAAAKLIREEERGWCVNYSVETIQEILQELLDNPQMIRTAAQKAIQAASNHTWESRARQVARELTALKK